MAQALIKDIKRHKTLELEGILTIYFNALILQMGKLRPGDRKGLAQDHTLS